MSSDALNQVAGLQELLNRCQRLIRIHALFRGFSETVCVLIAGLVFACLLDYFVALPGAFRFLLLAATVLMTGLVGWKRLVRPVLINAPDDELGAAVDLQFPELQESLATLISLEQPTTTSSEAGSLLMRQRLQKHVQSQIIRVEPGALIKNSRTWKRCGLALVSVVAILIPVMLWPGGSQLLVQRFLMPFSNLAAPSNLYFEVPEANRTVAINSDVSLIAIPQWRTQRAGSLPSEVTLEIQTATGNRDTRPMTFDDAEAHFEMTLADVRDSLRYRVQGGGATTEWFTLQVADPPRILSAVLQETPPAYTGRRVEVFDGVVGDIPVFERSQIEIRLQFQKPVHSARINWKNWTPIDAQPAAGAFNETNRNADESDLLPEEIAAAALAPAQSAAPEPPVAPAVLSDGGTVATFLFEALGGGPFEFHVEDDLGLTNASETSRRLIVTTDTPPNLTVSGISDGLDARPDDAVPLNCKVVDDLGVGLLELHFQKNTDAIRIQPAVPMDRGALSVMHDFLLDLKALELKAGDTVTFRVKAADERVFPGPQVVWKGPWTLRISDDAEPLGRKPLREADQQLVEALRALEEQLQRDEVRSQELKDQSQQQWDKETQEAVKALSEKEQTQGRELQGLAQQTAEHPLMQKQADKLTELAQQIREKLPEALNEAATGDRETAARTLQESSQQMNRLREELHKATDEIEKLAQLEQELTELNRLALDAQKLAQDSQKLQQDRANGQPEEGQSPEDHQQQLNEQEQKLRQEQQDLTDDLSKLLQRKQELLQSAREAQLDKAAAMARDAEQLARQQQRLAEGVNEEAGDTARDAQALADELQKSRNDAEQLGRQMKQDAQDVARPDVQTLDEAIRDLRRGNLAAPQASIDKVQQQLHEAAKQLNAPVDQKPADQKASESEPSASTENAGSAEEKNTAEQNGAAPDQNQKRQSLGQKAVEINERLQQLEDQLQKMAAELGAKPKQSEKSDATQADGASGKSPAEQAAKPSSSEPKAAQSPKPEEISRAMLQQMEQMRAAAHEQAEGLKADPVANDASKDRAQQAAERADEAKGKAEAGQFTQAAEKLRNAAEESDRASGELNAEASQDKKAQLQQQADNFGRMAETLKQLQQDNAAQVATQQKSQREVAEAAAAMPESLKKLAERMDLPALGMQHLARPAQEAAGAAQEAAQSGAQAAEQLNQTQMQQAGESAQESAGQLNRAAQLAQQAAQGHRDPEALIPTEVGESVSEALHSLQKAARMMNEEAARQAAEQQAQQAAQQGSADQAQAPQSEQGQPQPGQPGNEGQSDDSAAQPGDAADNPSGSQPNEGQPGEGQPGEGDSGADGQPGQGKGQPSAGKPGRGQAQPGESPASGEPQQNSSQQLANAAKALQSAAKGALPNQFSPGQLNSDGSTASGDPQGKGNPAQFDGRNPNASNRKGTGRKWGQLQDELDGNIGDAGKEVLDNEYSELIRRYRRDLARSTDKNAATKPDPKK